MALTIKVLHKVWTCKNYAGSTSLISVIVLLNNTNSFNFQFREYTDDKHEPITEMVINMYK